MAYSIIPLSRQLAREILKIEPTLLNLQVSSARKTTHTKSTDYSGSSLSKISRCYHGGLPDSDAGNKSAGIDHANASRRSRSEINTNSGDPDKAKLPGCPQTTDFIRDIECNQRSEDGS
jgi:hypothetical protein